ncbi:unnamed protein product, partial [Iphiclides podalirius]
MPPWKRLPIPTKVPKLVYVLIIAVSLLVIFLRLHCKREIATASTVAAVPASAPRREVQVRPKPGLKYILRWINPTNKPTEDGDGSLLFTARNCTWSNCYLTDRSDLLQDFSRFSAVLFDSPDIEYFAGSRKLPRRRARWQKFVYVSGDPAAASPVCDALWDGYFNWTWTYRLDSDLVWRYFLIRDARGRVVGPRRGMHWINVQNMSPVDSRYIMKLRSKTKIAAWFASNCKTQSKREEFVSEVQGYLSEYKLQVDVYGNCGEHVCPKSAMGSCLQMLSEEYYFYFAFESAMSEDYVTEIVLHALNHDTVPVVFGGANYTRFLPDGSYLNALHYGPERLARRMYEIMQNPSVYQMFFRWRSHYSYHDHTESQETDNYCALCAAVNEDSFNAFSLYKNFIDWWTPKEWCAE